jgi:hypothetical protein
MIDRCRSQFLATACITTIIKKNPIAHAVVFLGAGTCGRVDVAQGLCVPVIAIGENLTIKAEALVQAVQVGATVLSAAVTRA